MPENFQRREHIWALFYWPGFKPEERDLSEKSISWENYLKEARNLALAGREPLVLYEKFKEDGEVVGAYVHVPPDRANCDEYRLEGIGRPTKFYPGNPIFITREGKESKPYVSFGLRRDELPELNKLKQIIAGKRV